jgi:hypothetical protein
MKMQCYARERHAPHEYGAFYLTRSAMQATLVFNRSRKHPERSSELEEVDAESKDADMERLSFSHKRVLRLQFAKSANFRSECLRPFVIYSYSI